MTINTMTNGLETDRLALPILRLKAKVATLMCSATITVRNVLPHEDMFPNVLSLKDSGTAVTTFQTKTCGLRFADIDRFLSGYCRFDNFKG